MLSLFSELQSETFTVVRAAAPSAGESISLTLASYKCSSISFFRCVVSAAGKIKRIAAMIVCKKFRACEIAQRQNQSLPLLHSWKNRSSRASFIL